MDNSWLNQYYDPLIFDTQIESMELKKQEAVEMVDAIKRLKDGSVPLPIIKRATTSFALDDLNQKKRERQRVWRDDPLALAERLKAKENARRCIEKTRADPIAHAEFKRKDRARQRELLAQKKKDPVAYAEFKQKNNERKRESRNERKEDPIAYEEFKQKKRDRARELRAERKKDPIAYAQFRQQDKERRMRKMARME